MNAASTLGQPGCSENVRPDPQHRLAERDHQHELQRSARRAPARSSPPSACTDAGQPEAMYRRDQVDRHRRRRHDSRGSPGTFAPAIQISRRCRSRQQLRETASHAVPALGTRATMNPKPTTWRRDACDSERHARGCSTLLGIADDMTRSHRYQHDHQQRPGMLSDRGVGREACSFDADETAPNMTRSSSARGGTSGPEEESNSRVIC